MNQAVKKFSFDDEVLDALETSLSPERIATYKAETGGDREHALRLYTWNTAISAAFYGPLQGIEVALRNTMHQQLCSAYGEDWYENPACGLDWGALGKIDSAKSTLIREGYAVDPPHVVAELSFGFWVSLLGRGGRAAPPDRGKKNYEMTLWRPALHKAFPNSRLRRADTHRPLNYLRTFRNRIAHHEPIFNRHLQQDYRSILEVAGWICPKTTEWIQHHSRVEELLAHDWKNDGIYF
ncbi:MAG: Abi family protein [Sedimenticola sp.]